MGTTLKYFLFLKTMAMKVFFVGWTDVIMKLIFLPLLRKKYKNGPNELWVFDIHFWCKHWPQFVGECGNFHWDLKLSFRRDGLWH